jgi:hypothetical protein
MGNDPDSGRNYDHRKQWIEVRLQRFADYFGIDLLCFSILSNHFHLVLRSRPDVVATWDETEVARRWLMICPKRKDQQGNPREPTEWELNTIRTDPERLATIRRRLSDISWWMRLLSQPLAAMAHREEDQLGRFWQGRCRAVRICDEATLLACAAYVDLNPIRAALAETLDGSDYTSIPRRMESAAVDRPDSRLRTLVLLGGGSAGDAGPATHWSDAAAVAHATRFSATFRIAGGVNCGRMNLLLATPASLRPNSVGRPAAVDAPFDLALLRASLAWSGRTNHPE